MGNPADILVEEAPVATGQIPATLMLPGRVAVKQNTVNAPLEECVVTVELAVTAAKTGSVIKGLDLVAVLDISGSMADEQRLERVITAMAFVINKLGPNDRLSIITFAENAKTVCALRITNDSFKDEIKRKVSELKPNGGTNIADGLRTGLDVLNNRKQGSERVGAIMLMSDGEQNQGGDAAAVKDKNINILPVFTFGFGSGQEPKVLKAISKNSREGTFSEARVLDSFISSFNAIFALLITVIVQDLKVSIDIINGNALKINKVTAGDYVIDPNTEKTATISFGNLSQAETLTVTVELLLPAVTKPGSRFVLQTKPTYRVGSQLSPSPTPGNVKVGRSGKASKPQTEEPTLEATRLDAAKLMKAARVLAENKNLVEAKASLNQAQQLVDDADDETSPVIKTLKYELKFLLSTLKSLEEFNQKGLPFALSSETSHERQRFAGRGNPEQVVMFATPRITQYMEQAKLFVENPNAPLPTAEEDVKQEVAADPLGPVAGGIEDYIQTAIQALQAISDILSASRT